MIKGGGFRRHLSSRRYPDRHPYRGGGFSFPGSHGGCPSGGG